MNLLRVTVIDRNGGVSFIAHGDALPALVNACGFYPQTLEDLLDLTAPYYAALREYVLDGLAVFDEHNAGGNYENIHRLLKDTPKYERPVFRIVDAFTREASLRPVGAGAVVLNLTNRRVIQIQNTYRELKREGQALVFDGDAWKPEVFRYRLPRDWALVP
jgi:hypothetical protein